MTDNDSNNVDERKRETSESPVPSFTLQITKHDADKFLQASRELEYTMRRVEAASVSSTEHNKNTSLSTAAEETRNGNAPMPTHKKPLHELLYDAALECQHPLVTSILEREAAFRIPELEAKAAFLLFHDSDKTAKLRHYFRILSSSSSTSNDDDYEDNKLDRSGVLSLFRSVLLSLSCCVHTPDEHRMGNVVVEGKPESRSPDEQQRPTKRVKHEDDTASTKPFSETDDGALPEIRDAEQSGSFDSSIATLRHEDEKDSSISGNLRREIEEVAAYAADEVIGFARALDNDNTKVDLVMFGDWYNKTGRTIVPWLELLQPSKWKSRERSTSREDSTAAAEQEQSESPSSLLTEEPDSRAILSFDFSDPSSPCRVVVHISEDNIMALRFFVQRTGLTHRPPEDICRALLQLSKQRKTISREVFQREYYRLIPPDVFGTLSSAEKEAFQEALLGYFTAFEDSDNPSLHDAEVDLKELALGFCFFCAGNKSTKLALGFDLLDTTHSEFLTESQLLRFLQAYLSMLVATSLLIPIPKRQTHRAISLERRKLMHAAVHRGAEWTLGHFVKDIASTIRDGHYSFDAFAQWYSLSGYNVAPWLELLDLHKLFALVPSEIPSPMRLPSFDHQQEREQRQGPITTASTARRTNRPRDRVSSLRRHHSARRRGRPEILFTFPLANHRSLVVLKDDAVYVRDVVDQLGLLSVRPETLWEALALTVKKRRGKPKQPEDAPEYVDMGTFVHCVQEICPKLSRKRSNLGDSIVRSAAVEELLSNFFQCFDLNQADRVAIDELMGGLSLLCGGKKSTKLAFAFSIFDTRPGAHDKKRKERFAHSLSGEDLFLFLRSILIVTFSCCRQSLDMSDEQVGRCIADTANMICNDVMRYQWETKQLDRLDFDEFGQWYNDGGFERAPWLELLDLGKWVLVDDYNSLQIKSAPPHSHQAAPSSALSPRPSGLTPRPSGLTPRARDHVRFPDDPAVPPPPPEDALDTSFFDENAIMPMDSMDEMDMILMQPSMDKETDVSSPKLMSPRISRSFSYPSPREQQHQQKRKSNSLKFHLVTHESHGGYMLSVSTTRIAHLRRIIIESGFHTLDAETVCNAILSKASRSKISKQSFDLAMKSLIPGLSGKKPPSEDMKTFSNLLSEVFAAFDPANTGRARAIEVACGFTVLCRGKKSDKLEFAFEVLDRNKKGRLSKADTASYLQSFLTVLLSVAISPLLDNDRSDDTLTTIKGGGRCELSPKILSRAVKAGAEWASGLAFSSLSNHNRNDAAGTSMTFDDFAAWYTTAGYSSIPWLELLDLHKWVLAS